MSQNQLLEITQKEKTYDSGSFSDIKLKVFSYKITNKFFLFLSVFSLVFGTVSSGQTAFDDQTKDPEIGVVEHLDEFLPTDIYLIDENNQRVVLTDLIDKPTIINWVYYRCRWKDLPMS